MAILQTCFTEGCAIKTLGKFCLDHFEDARFTRAPIAVDADGDRLICVFVQKRNDRLSDRFVV